MAERIAIPKHLSGKINEIFTYEWIYCNLEASSVSSQLQKAGDMHHYFIRSSKTEGEFGDSYHVYAMVQWKHEEPLEEALMLTDDNGFEVHVHRTGEREESDDMRRTPDNHRVTICTNLGDDEIQFINVALPEGNLSTY